MLRRRGSGVSRSRRTGERLGRENNLLKGKQTEQGELTPPLPDREASATRAPASSASGGSRRGARFLQQEEDAKAANEDGDIRTLPVKAPRPTKVTVSPSPTSTPQPGVAPGDRRDDSNSTDTPSSVRVLRVEEGAETRDDEQSKDVAVLVDVATTETAECRVQRRRGVMCTGSTTPALHGRVTPPDVAVVDCGSDGSSPPGASETTASSLDPTQGRRRGRLFRAASTTNNGSSSSARSFMHTAVLVFLLAWAAFFGGKTVRRCEDWRSERTLFQSAIRVCPNGIKTLNNLAAGMLNVEESGHAERLLRRALKVSVE